MVWLYETNIYFGHKIGDSIVSNVILLFLIMMIKDLELENYPADFIAINNKIINMHVCARFYT